MNNIVSTRRAGTKSNKNNFKNFKNFNNNYNKRGCIDSFGVSTKFIVLLLAALLVLPLSLASCAGGGNTEFSLPTRALPENAAEQRFGSFGYMVYDDNTVVLTSYSGSESSIIIPDSIEGMPVIALGAELFFDNDTIRSVRLGRNVEELGDFCFSSCDALYDITIPDKLWKCGTFVFDGTPWLDSLTDDFVIIGDGVLIKYRGTDTSVTVPDNVKHISCAFETNTALMNVVIGDSVLTVGNYSFAYCDALRAVKLGSNVRLIGVHAFDECGMMTSLEIPDSVEIIDDYAFNYCGSLTDVKLGESVRQLGYYSFYSCVRVRAIYFPASLTEVMPYSFGECYALSIIFYNGTEEDFAAIERNTTNYIMNDAEKIYNASSGR